MEDFLSSLPDELHLRILEHLDPNEWRATKFANYRLTCRRYAAIGAQEMFGSFHFRASTAALERIRAIADSDLKRYVKVLDFDGELKDHEGNVLRIEEEMRTGVFRNVVLGFGAENFSINWFVAQSLPCSMFWAPNMTSAFTASCANVTRLLLSLDIPEREPRVAETGALPTFVASLAHLQDLQLMFRPDGGKYAPVALKDILPVNYTWPKLKLLMLEYVRFEGDDFVALLACHAATLENFHFRYMRFASSPDQISENNVELIKLEKAWTLVLEQITKLQVLKDGYVMQGDADERKRVVRVRMERPGVEVDITTDLGHLWAVHEDVPEILEGGLSDEGA